MLPAFEPALDVPDGLLKPDYLSYLVFDYLFSSIPLKILSAYISESSSELYDFS